MNNNGFDYLIYNVLYHEDFYLYQDLMYSYYGSLPVKIIDEENKINYCFQSNVETENCAEATYKVIEGKEIYNCTVCLKGYDINYNLESDVNYCTKKPMKCLVHFCKECEPDNNYFCSKCLTSEYEICEICCTNKRDTYFLPCRHSYACKECAMMLRIRGNGCPICRKRKLKFYNIF
jgi:hypothetical protein